MSYLKAVVLLTGYKKNFLQTGGGRVTLIYASQYHERVIGFHKPITRP